MEKSHDGESEEDRVADEAAAESIIGEVAARRAAHLHGESRVNVATFDSIASAAAAAAAAAESRRARHDNVHDAHAFPLDALKKSVRAAPAALAMIERRLSMDDANTGTVEHVCSLFRPKRYTPRSGAAAGVTTLTSRTSISSDGA